AKTWRDGAMIFPFVFLVTIPVVLLIGAVILRAAIAFANGRLGAAADDKELPIGENDWGDYPIPGERRGSSSQIPVPSIAGGMGMMLCIVIVNIIIGAAIRLGIGDEP